MQSMAKGSTLRVSSEFFAVVSFPEGEALGAEGLPHGSLPLHEQSFLVPEMLVPQLPSSAQVTRGSWRRLEVFGPFAKSELLAAASSALAEVEVPVLVLSRAQGLWLFVPQEKLGRALAALRQARLARFATTP